MISTPVINTTADAIDVLRTYEVDYTDPTNFIYVANGVTGPKPAQEAAALYLAFFDEEEIEFEDELERVTSFPIYPNMVSCILGSTKLKSIPVQPEMDTFSIDKSELVSFPVQPKMRDCSILRSELTRFPMQTSYLQYLCLAYNKNAIVVNHPDGDVVVDPTSYDIVFDYKNHLQARSIGTI